MAPPNWNQELIFSSSSQTVRFESLLWFCVLEDGSTSHAFDGAVGSLAESLRKLSPSRDDRLQRGWRADSFHSSWEWTAQTYPFLHLPKPPLTGTTPLPTSSQARPLQVIHPFLHFSSCSMQVLHPSYIISSHPLQVLHAFLHLPKLPLTCRRYTPSYIISSPTLTGNTPITFSQAHTPLRSFQCDLTDPTSYLLQANTIHLTLFSTIACLINQKSSRHC